MKTVLGDLSMDSHSFAKQIKLHCGLTYHHSFRVYWDLKIFDKDPSL